MCEKPPYVDIRYGIVKEQGGQGLAFEAASRCVEWGFDDVKLTTIYGVAVHENIASCTILKKLGMQTVDIDFYNAELDYFAITR